jgi:acetate---CoA ligase (ADP-forming) subunit beta
MEMIQSALAMGHRALSEYESKLLLKTYGIPVAQEFLTVSLDDALAAAVRVGYPVALKACSPELMHKTESGALILDIRNEAELRNAFERIRSSVQIELDGVLVQEIIRGHRELVLGLIRDSQFGPCVMIGFGGIMTEVVDDTVFRVAPLDREEALEMVQELHSRKMLDRFRGQAPADLTAISNSLVALGRIGLSHDAVAEIDINPMKIDPQGRAVAVDALVVLNAETG